MNFIFYSVCKEFQWSTTDDEIIIEEDEDEDGDQLMDGDATASGTTTNSNKTAKHYLENEVPGVLAFLQCNIHSNLLASLHYYTFFEYS